MNLNVLGQKMNDTIAEIPTHHPYAKIPVYQVMPNHVHLIVCIDETKMKRNAVNTDAVNTDVAGTNAVNTDAAGTNAVNTDAAGTDAAGHVSTDKKMQAIAERCGLLSVAMGGMKSALTKYANTHKIEFGWQTRFHDHIIRDREEWERISNYIENNPKTWEDDKFYLN